jgi:hypothetical protein
MPGQESPGHGVTGKCPDEKLDEMPRSLVQEIFEGAEKAPEIRSPEQLSVTEEGKGIRGVDGKSQVTGFIQKVHFL